MIDKDGLIAFEADIAELFEAGQIRSPCHLSGGNEDALIDIFQHIKRTDWCFSNHRNHYHALLKGIPPEWLKAEILANHSITINNAEYKFFSSAIVGGILPIAVGVAMMGETAWVFVGDMAARTGVFNECYRYAHGHHLPIKFVIEDNDWSVDTPTRHVWGGQSVMIEYPFSEYYAYKRVYPHQGSGKWVSFDNFSK